MSVLSGLFGVAIAQGAFLVLVLATMRVRNSTARWLLVGIVAVLTLVLGEELLDLSGSRTSVGIGMYSEFILWPLTYLFVMSLAEDDPRPLSAHWLHFLPIAIAIGWYAASRAGSGGEWVSVTNPETRGFVSSVVLVKVAFFCVYAGLILRRPMELGSKPELVRRALRWVSRLTRVLLAAYCLVMISFLAFFVGFDWAVDSDFVGGVFITISIYGIGYFAIVNRHVFDIQAKVPAGADELASQTAITTRAQEWLDEYVAYRDPDFGLRDLADGLELSEKHISNALNQTIDGGFYALVNDFRLRRCLELMDDPENRSRTVLELAYEAGFASKATFYRHFRARIGMTPKAYRASP